MSVLFLHCSFSYVITIFGEMEMSQTKTGQTIRHSQLGVPEKDGALKWLFFEGFSYSHVLPGEIAPRKNDLHPKISFLKYN